MGESPRWLQYLDMLTHPRDVADQLAYPDTRRVFVPEQTAATLAESFVLHQTLMKWRYRFTAANFLLLGKELPLAEQRGLVYLVSLVNAADDAIDSGTIPLDRGVDVLRASLLQVPVILPENRSRMSEYEAISLEKVMQMALNSFGSEKQELLQRFLDTSLAAEVYFRNRAPGTYSFDEGMAYRQLTSEAYSRVGCALIGLDPVTTEQQVHIGVVAQLLDDAMDIFADFNAKSINPFIAYCFSWQEQDSLATLSSHYPQNALSKILFSLENTRKIPHTREFMKDLILRENMSVVSPVIRHAVRLLTRF